MRSRNHTLVGVTASLFLIALMPGNTSLGSAPAHASAVAYSSAVTSTDTLAFDDPDGFWAVRYPKTWILDTAGSEQQFLRDRSGAAGFAVSVQIKALTPAAMVQQVSTLLEAKRDGYEETDRGDAEIDGLPAAWIEHAYTVEGEPYVGILVGVVRNRVGVLVVGWAPKNDAEAVQQSFTAFVDSLTVPRFDEAPDYSQWTAKRSTHFTYRYLPGTYVASNILTVAKQHEAAYTSIVKSLSLKPTGRVNMYFYPSDTSLYRATARDAGFAISPAQEVHTVWVSAGNHQSLGHEMTHVITASTMGEPAEALLGEGIAVCFDQATPSPHARAAALRRSGKLVSVSRRLGDSFFDVDAAVRYPQSGSIACWLVEQYGVTKFKQLYAAKDFTTTLRNAYGLDVNSLERRWLASLGSA